MITAMASQITADQAELEKMDAALQKGRRADPSEYNNLIKRYNTLRGGVRQEVSAYEIKSADCRRPG